MQKILFHNRHDQASRELVAAQGQDVQIVDIFGGDEIPPNYRVCVLPYLVDKELVYAGEDVLIVAFPATLDFALTAADATGMPIDFGEAQFKVCINGQEHMAVPENGGIAFDVEVQEPTTLQILITNDQYGYHPWERTISVQGAV